MVTVIVPDYLNDKINAAIDKALNGRPCDGPSRDLIYSKILDHFFRCGEIPDFKLTEQEPTP